MEPGHDYGGLAELHPVCVVPVDVLGQGPEKVLRMQRISFQGGPCVLGSKEGQYADVELVVLLVVAGQCQERVCDSGVTVVGGFEPCAGGLERVLGVVHVLAIDQGEQVADGLWPASRVLMCRGTDDAAPWAGRGKQRQVRSRQVAGESPAITLPML